MTIDLLTALKRFFPADRHHDIDRLAAQPEFSAAAARAEQEKIEERKALLAQHAELPHVFEQEQRTAQRAEQDAAARLASAKAALAEAEKAFATACGVAMSASLKEDAMRGKLSAAIVGSADPLIAAAVHALRDAMSTLRHLVQVTVAPEADGRRSLHTNSVQVAAAMAACTGAVKDCEALAWQALSSAEVQAEIDRILRRVAPGLISVGTGAPQITDNGIQLGRLPQLDAPRAAPPGTRVVPEPPARRELAGARAVMRDVLS